MPAIISFVSFDPGPGPSKIARVRATEMVTVPGVTTTKALRGELAVVANNDAAMILVAFGSAPDATTAADLATSSAGFPVEAASVSPLFAVPGGAKIAVKGASSQPNNGVTAGVGL